jgi:transcriptional regulator with XRE-family HTH domain
MDYGKAIRILRAFTDMSQRQLAERVGADPSLISMLEAGKRQPSRDTMEKISSGLNVPLHLFILLATQADDTKSVNAANLQQLATELARLLLVKDDDGKSSEHDPKTEHRKRETALTASRKQPRPVASSSYRNKKSLQAV